MRWFQQQQLCEQCAVEFDGRLGSEQFHDLVFSGSCRRRRDRAPVGRSGQARFQH